MNAILALISVSILLVGTSPCQANNFAFLNDLPFASTAAAPLREPFPVLHLKGPGYAIYGARIRDFSGLNYSCPDLPTMTGYSFIYPGPVVINGELVLCEKIHCAMLDPSRRQWNFFPNLAQPIGNQRFARSIIAINNTHLLTSLENPRRLAFLDLKGNIFEAPGDSTLGSRSLTESCLVKISETTVAVVGGMYDTDDFLVIYNFVDGTIPFRKNIYFHKKQLRFAGCELVNDGIHGPEIMVVGGTSRDEFTNIFSGASRTNGFISLLDYSERIGEGFPTAVSSLSLVALDNRTIMGITGIIDYKYDLIDDEWTFLEAPKEYPHQIGATYYPGYASQCTLRGD